MAYTDNDTYRHIHFAVMAIESGARKLGISVKEVQNKTCMTSWKVALPTIMSLIL